MTGRARTVAVVGAGIAGLACAHALSARGIGVVVFDKGRAVGGRLTTRRMAEHTFDLGAQYFTTRTEVFAAEVQRWREADVCAPWSGRILALYVASGARKPTPPTERLVGTPGMSAVARHLARSLEVRTGHRVDAIARRADQIALRGTVAPAGITLGPAHAEARGEGELGAFDAVVLCLPPSQAAELLRGPAPGLAGRAEGVAVDPCFAVGFAASSRDRASLAALDFEGAFIGRQHGDEREPRGDVSSALGWVARDSSKPGRPAGERWVLHATAAWSRWAVDLPDADVVRQLLGELSRLFDLDELRPDVASVKRWAFAHAPAPLSCGALFDDVARIGVGGDWASGGRVEGAFLSGLALAQKVLGAADMQRTDREAVATRRSRS